MSDLWRIGVATRPGLVGSLMIGGQLAKCLSLATGLPVFEVDHIESHMYACCLEGYEPVFPSLGLLVSGGNTAIYTMQGPGRLSVLADTQDDACGEAFDKLASILGLPYPGGPHIERLSAWEEMSDLGQRGVFPRILKNLPGDQMGFSFSGIKTAAARAVRAGVPPARICTEFQRTVFELIIRNLRVATRKTGVRRIVAAGGVLANETLRRALDEAARQFDWELVYPDSKMLCTDNAAMVAALAHRIGGQRSDLGFSVSSRSAFASS